MPTKDITLLKTALLISSNNLPLIKQYLDSQVSDPGFDLHYILALLLIHVDELEPVESLSFVSELSTNEEIDLNEAEADLNGEHTENSTQAEDLINSLFQSLQLDDDPITLAHKAALLRADLDDKAQQWKFETDDESLKGFVEARLRRVYAVNKAFNYESLLSFVKEKDDEYDQWIVQVVRPLIYYNQVTGGEKLEFSEFESLTVDKRLQLITSTLINLDSYEIHPTVENLVKSLTESSIQEYITLTKPLQDESQYIITHNVLQANPTSSSIPDLVRLCYEYEDINDATLSTILQSLQIYHSKFPSNEEINQALSYVRASVVIQPSLPLSQLRDISQDLPKQEHFLQSYLNTIKTSSISNAKGETIIVDHLIALKPVILPLIPSQKFSTSLTSQLLKLKHFQYLESHKDLLSNVNTDDVLIPHIWDRFKAATNAFRDRGELQAAVQTLELLDSQDEKVRKLNDLITLIDDISQYKIYFIKGVPFKPSDLLNLESSEPLLQKLLELNDGLYTHPTKLSQIQSQLHQTLSIPIISDLQIKTLCIESSLVQDDLQFALHSTQSLFSSHSSDELSSHWVTFLQVIKHRPFTACHTIEQIKTQMKLSISLLQFISPSDSQTVLSQWQALNTELITLESTDEQRTGFSVLDLNQSLKALDGVQEGGRDKLRELSEGGKGLIRAFGGLF